MAAAPPAACRARQLDLRRGEAQRPGPLVQDEEGRTVGTFATDFVLRNTSSSPCLLNGWAGQAFFGEGVETACPPPPGTPPPGVTATFSLTWTGAICLSEPHRLDIRVPGDATRFQVTRPRDCISGPLDVTPLGTPAPHRGT